MFLCWFNVISYICNLRAKQTSDFVQKCFSSFKNIFFSGNIKVLLNPFFRNGLFPWWNIGLIKLFNCCLNALMPCMHQCGNGLRIRNDTTLNYLEGFVENLIQTLYQQLLVPSKRLGKNIINSTRQIRPLCLFAKLTTLSSFGNFTPFCRRTV